MSDWTVQLELVEGGSSKFWRARVEGKTLYVNYGKIGSNGQTQVKDLASPDAARKEYDKLVAEKRKKGYGDAGASGGGEDAEADEAEDDGDEDGGDDDEGGEEEEEGDDDDDAPKKAKKPAKAAPAPAAPPTTVTRPAGGHRLTLTAGSRQIETQLYLDGKTVRMDAVETFASPEAAKKAFDRLKQSLAADGYQD